MDRETEEAIKDRLSTFLKDFRRDREKLSLWIALGLDPAKMGRFENKMERPSLPRLMELCLRLNISANWLLFGRGPQELVANTAPHHPRIIGRNLERLRQVYVINGSNGDGESSVEEELTEE